MAWARQQPFCATLADLDVLEDVLRGRGAAILTLDSESGQYQELPVGAIRSLGSTNRSAYLVRPEDVSTLSAELLPMPDGDGQFWTSNQDRGARAVDLYVHDWHVVPTGEFTDWELKVGWMSHLGANRLFYAARYWPDSGEEFPHPPDFVRWADGLLRWLRRHWVAVGSGWRAGPEAVERFRALDAARGESSSF